MRHLRRVRHYSRHPKMLDAASRKLFNALRHKRDQCFRAGDMLSTQMSRLVRKNMKVEQVHRHKHIVIGAPGVKADSIRIGGVNLIKLEARTQDLLRMINRVYDHARETRAMFREKSKIRQRVKRE